MNDIKTLLDYIDSMTPLEFFATCLSGFLFLCWLEVKLKLNEYKKNKGGWLN